MSIADRVILFLLAGIVVAVRTPAEDAFDAGWLCFALVVFIWCAVAPGDAA